MELTIEKAQFAKTSLEQISEALKKGLQKNYKLVETKPKDGTWGINMNMMSPTIGKYIINEVS